MTRYEFQRMNSKPRWGALETILAILYFAAMAVSMVWFVAWTFSLFLG